MPIRAHVRAHVLFTGAAVLTAFILSAPAHALTMKECSAKYQAAKEAGTLGGMKWNEFRKSECGPDEEAATTRPTKNAAPAPSAGRAASGLSMQECSERYQAAKASDELQGLNWNAFRKTYCSAEAAAAASTLTTGRAVAAGTGNTVFPRGISPKYSSESAGKARMHTCLDQYKANKASNRNGGLRWIEKGGGYYSECNRRLSQQ